MKKKNTLIIISIVILLIGASAIYLLKNCNSKNKNEINGDIFTMLEKEKTDYIGDRGIAFKDGLLVTDHFYLFISI